MGSFLFCAFLFLLTCSLYNTVILFILFSLCVFYATIKNPALGLFVSRLSSFVYRPPSIVLRLS